MASVFSKQLQKSTNVRFKAQQLAAAGVVRVLGDALPGLTGDLARWLFTSPGRHVRPSRERGVLRRGRRVRIPLGLHGIRGWTWGEGPTVLLVHGWEGRGSQLCAFVDPLVEAGFRVVAFDAPGHGDSGGDQATLFTFASAVDAAARRFGPIHGLIAHSMGAAASAYAIRGGLPVERVVFVGAADAGQALDRFARQVGLGPESARRVNHDLVRRYGLPIQSLAAESMGRGLGAELLVVHDVDDRWTPIEDGEAYVRGAGGELFRTEGLGHHRILRDPEVVRRAVGFVSEGDRVEPDRWAEHEPEAVVLKHWTVPDLFALEIEAAALTDEELLADLDYGRD